MGSEPGEPSASSLLLSQAFSHSLHRNEVTETRGNNKEVGQNWESV